MAKIACLWARQPLCFIPLFSGQEYLTIYIRVSIFRHMTVRAKLFQNGGSQAVRLPKSCRFPAAQQDVVVRRDGRRVILEPADEWPPEFLKILGAWNEQIERPPSRRVTALRDPFASQ
jgi:antitoxin VapB